MPLTRPPSTAIAVPLPHRWGGKCITGFALVSPVLHDGEPEPPSLGRGWHRRRRRIGASGLPPLSYIFGPILRASPSSIPVGQAKGRPFYGQAKGQLCPTWQSYAGLPPEEGAYVTGFPSRPTRHSERQRRISVQAAYEAMLLNAGLREGCSILFLGFICDE